MSSSQDSANRDSVRGAHPPVEQDITLSSIVVYPIKSCMGISLQESRFTQEGLEFDRRWIIVDIEKNKQLSPRDNRGIKLVRVKPTINLPRGTLDVSFPDDPSVPSFSVPLNPTIEEVSAWDQVEGFDLWGSNLNGVIVPPMSPGAPDPSTVLSTFTGHPVKFVMKPPTHLRLAQFQKIKAADLDYEGGPRIAFSDRGPLLIVSTSSFVHAQERIKEAQKTGTIEWDVNQEISIDRWRPNWVVDGVEQPFGEDDWIEAEVGDKKNPFLFPGRTPRCLFPNVDPATAIRHPHVPHKVMMDYRRVDPTPALKNKYFFGVYGVPVAEAGVVRVGDNIKVIKHAGPVSQDA